MTEIIRQQTTVELFKELVESAIAHQRLTTSEESVCYLVHLLEAFVRPDRLSAAAGAAADRPLAEILLTATAADGMRRAALLKLTGDTALFVTGFQGDSLARSLVDVDYYIRLGGYAYGTIAEHRSGDPAAALFAELAAHFPRFVDVLCEVSETCALTDTTNILRLYEKWLRTGSPRTAELLRGQGITPVPVPTTVH